MVTSSCRFGTLTKEIQTMTNAAAANEYKSNVGHDYRLEAELADYAAEQEAEDVDNMTTAQRQALNAAMFDYFFG